MKAKKVSKSQEQSVLMGECPIVICVLESHNQNNKASYNLINEYLENPGKIPDCKQIPISATL